MDKLQRRVRITISLIEQNDIVKDIFLSELWGKETEQETKITCGGKRKLLLAENLVLVLVNMIVQTNSIL